MKKGYFHSILLIILFSIIISCNKDTITQELQGKWVRVDNNVQVIKFGYLNNDDWFTLNTGFRIDNEGTRRPVEFLGEYAVKNSCDSISIHWMHSSLSVWPKYYFAMKDSEIEIGDMIYGTDSVFVFRREK